MEMVVANCFRGSVIVHARDSHEHTASECFGLKHISCGGFVSFHIPALGPQSLLWERPEAKAQGPHSAPTLRPWRMVTS